MIPETDIRYVRFRNTAGEYFLRNLVYLSNFYITILDKMTKNFFWERFN